MTVEVDTERLMLDWHPVDITQDDRVLATRCRAFITDRRVIAYAADDQRNIVKVLDIPHETGLRPNRLSARDGSRLMLHATDGAMLYVVKSLGCGCGSPLRAMMTPVPW